MSAEIPAPLSADRLRDFRHHWQDEADAAFLYRALAEVEADEGRRDIFLRLAAVEDRHGVLWEQVLTEAGHPPGPARPSATARLRALLGRRLGPRFLVPMLLAEEGREVKGYLDLHRDIPHGSPGRKESLLLAQESAQHASTLAELTESTGRGGEPWHRTESGGHLRNVVYGFNDGLTANFGLVAGVLGATAAQRHEAIIVAGVAGLIADALSMGSSGFLAAKSELEVYENEIAMERDEIAMMPEIERDELAILYEAKGMDVETAQRLAGRLMEDPEQMLAEHVREELKIGEATISPLREAWITGLATGIGALIPVFPFFLASGRIAIWASLAVSMLSHFMVGAGRSVFTGRGLLRSGFDMFVVGFGVAAVGYFVGAWVSRLL